MENIAKELHSLLLTYFEGIENKVDYKELRYEDSPEYNTNILIVKKVYTEYYNLGGYDIKDLVIEFDPETNRIKDFYIG